MVVYKYKLETIDVQSFLIHKGYEILTVHTQCGTPYMWVKVDTEVEKEAVIIDTFGTGYSFTEIKRKYIGSYQLNSGNLIFHVFDRM